MLRGSERRKQGRGGSPALTSLLRSPEGFLFWTIMLLMSVLVSCSPGAMKSWEPLVFLILGRGPGARKHFAALQTLYVQKFKSFEYLNHLRLKIVTLAYNKLFSSE